MCNNLLSIKQRLVPVTEKKFLSSRARPLREVDNLSAICEPIVWPRCGQVYLPFPPLGETDRNVAANVSGTNSIIHHVLPSSRVP
jgi:hypothetical protein